MSISNLTAKQLKIDIKKGCTPEDLEQRYGCSNEDLRKRIQQLYSQGNGRIIRQFLILRHPISVFQGQGNILFDEFIKLMEGRVR